MVTIKPYLSFILSKRLLKFASICLEVFSIEISLQKEM